MVDKSSPFSVGPYISGQAVTPTDDQDLPTVARGLYIGGGSGAIAVVFRNDADDAPVTLTGLITGRTYPFYVRRVLKTGTTATGIVALQ